jgi:hypothetical protein
MLMNSIVPALVLAEPLMQREFATTELKPLIRQVAPTPGAPELLTPFGELCS